MDTDLSTEIDNKIEGDLKKFLLILLKNRNLDDDKTEVDEKRVVNDAKEFKKNPSFTSNLFLDKIMLTYTKRELAHFFLIYPSVNNEDLFNKMDNSKPIVKAVRVIQNCSNNYNVFRAEKLQKNLKSNKGEFLRLLAFYPQVSK